MAMTSGLMTRIARLVARQTYHLRDVYVISLASCAPALGLQMRPHRYNFSPGD
ncbi:hypothetical protein BDR03DRAFT_966302 [Suillus americanus]|nr:hypothetical protein BDR03DRAFT_966302 [Suillus americanus]